MKEIIKNMLNKAYEEKDLDLANIANDLMSKLSSTHNCPTNPEAVVEGRCKTVKFRVNNDYLQGEKVI